MCRPSDEHVPETSITYSTGEYLAFIVSLFLPGTYLGSGQWAANPIIGIYDSDDNDLNQYGDVTYDGVQHDIAYDNNGCLIAAEAFLSANSHEYVYDAENRLIEVWQGGTKVSEYVYDAMGRRIQKTVGAVVTSYVYNGNLVLAEYENGILTRKFIYGSGIDQPIAMEVLTGPQAGVYFYHSDGLGSVAALSQLNAGTVQVVERYQYDAFGQTTVTLDGSLSNPYRYTGRRYDVETGLYYYRARMYSSQLGRFLQPDPIGYADGMNMYAYCGNNPVNWIDPWGLCKEGDEDDPVLAGAAGIDPGDEDIGGHGRPKQSKGSKKKNRDDHQKGQKRLKQKYKDKKRQKPGWQVNKITPVERLAWLTDKILFLQPETYNQIGNVSGYVGTAAAGTVVVIETGGLILFYAATPEGQMILQDIQYAAP